jgi:hypothetical protein
MAAIKPLSEIVDKFTTVTPARASEYERGVRAPRTDWQTATTNAAALYKAAVTKAASEGRFEAGVKQVSTSDWQQASIQKGAPRFGPGVSLAGPDYQAGFAPFHRVIEATALPPRQATGSPGNIQRVSVITAALHQAKASKK